MREDESATLTLEYLGTPEPERRRAPVRIVAGILLMAAAAAGFLRWSDVVRTSANDALLASFEASAARAASGERQVQGTLAYASPMIWSTSVPEEVRDGLRALVEASAAEVASDLGALGDQVAATTILPWHGPQQEAREELLGLIDAQRARFDGIARDASDIDMILADGPLPMGVVVESLRASGAEAAPIR